jgi:hypothetical protein
MASYNPFIASTSSVAGVTAGSSHLLSAIGNHGGAVAAHHLYNPVMALSTSQTQSTNSNNTTNNSGSSVNNTNNNNSNSSNSSSSNNNNNNNNSDNNDISDHRSSSIAALRLRAKEHSVALGTI